MLSNARHQHTCFTLPHLSASQHTPHVLLQWWPGQIADSVKDDTGGPKRATGGEIIYTINYEEHGEFEAEQCQVAFLSPRVLRDMDTGACMAWRVQGDTWEDAEGVLKDYADESEGEEEIVSASEFLERQMSELQYGSSLVRAYHHTIACPALMSREHTGMSSAECCWRVNFTARLELTERVMARVGMRPGSRRRRRACNGWKPTCHARPSSMVHGRCGSSQTCSRPTWTSFESRAGMW